MPGRTMPPRALRTRLAHQPRCLVWACIWWCPVAVHGTCAPQPYHPTAGQRRAAVVAAADELRHPRQLLAVVDVDVHPRLEREAQLGHGLARRVIHHARGRQQCLQCLQPFTSTRMIGTPLTPTPARPPSATASRADASGYPVRKAHRKSVLHLRDGGALGAMPRRLCTCGVLCTRSGIQRGGEDEPTGSAACACASNIHTCTCGGECASICSTGVHACASNSGLLDTSVMDSVEPTACATLAAQVFRRGVGFPEASAQVFTSRDEAAARRRGGR